MSNKLFLPFLTDDIGRSLDVDNSVVVTSAIPNPLENAPEGWEKNIVQFSRNTEFRGIIKAYITNLKFYLEGATILRNAFYRLGMETVIFFIWLKQNRNFGAGMKYEGWYKGEVDFGSYKDEYDGVEVNVTEGGFYKHLQANKGVVNEYPLKNDPEAVSLYMDGLNLHQSLNYSDVELDVLYVDQGAQFLGPYILLGQDGASTGFIIHTEDLSSVYGLTFDQAKVSDNYIIKNLTLAPVDILITGKIEFTCTQNIGSPGFSMQFRYITSKQSSATPNTYQIINTVVMVVGTTYSADISIPITLQPDESLLREGLFTGVSIQAVIKFTSNSNTKITFITRAVSNVVLAFRAFDLGNKIVKKISTASTTLSSPLLEPDYNLLITSGDAIRSIPTAVIKTSFSDYYKSIDAVKCLSLKVVDNNPVILSRYDDFNTTTIADLGECNKWELEPAKEYIYDGVEVGYPSKSTGSNIDVNGKYSFNNTFIWALNVTRKDAVTYQAKSAYFADPYDIELIRVNFNQKDTTTANTDNSVFFLDCEPKTDINYTGTVNFSGSLNKLNFVGSTTAITPFIIIGTKIQVTGSTSNNQIFTVTGIVNSPFFGLQLNVLELVTTEVSVVTVSIYNLYQLRRLPYVSITGIPNDGTVFNIELSPRRILGNHLRWLRSSFDHLDQNKLIFKSTEKNADLATFDSGGVLITEKADIPVYSMGAKVFLPYYTLSEFASPENLLDLMTANSSGKFNYKRNGQDMEGFPIDIKTDDSYLTTQQYRLLLTANNDLTKLILR